LTGLKAAKPTAFFHKMDVLGENENAEAIGKKDGTMEGWKD
jgi:hypothetical protein